MRQLLPLAFLLVSSSLLPGQTLTFNAGSRTTLQLTGAPYCADQVSESRQTLSDGTHIIRMDHGITHTCRDSAGRVRLERAPFGGALRHGQPNPGAGMKQIEIYDTVAGFTYILDPQKQIAHRVGLQTVNPNRPRLKRIGKADDGPQFTTESLGNKTINGVQAIGTLDKVIYPADWEGNDRPITVTTETWKSPVLQVTLLSSDPRSGEHIERLENLTTIEPDPSLFQPPAGYRIVDETTDFKIQYTTP